MIETVHSPEKYAQHIAKSRVDNRSVITQMSSDNFYDLSAILSTTTKRNVTMDKKKFDFREVCQFRVTSQYLHRMEIKNTCEESEQWQIVSLQRCS